MMELIMQTGHLKGAHKDFHRIANFGIAAARIEAVCAVSEKFGGI